MPQHQEVIYIPTFHNRVSVSSFEVICKILLHVNVMLDTVLFVLKDTHLIWSLCLSASDTLITFE